MAIKHPFTSGKSDGGDATLVRPSNWNADHTMDSQVLLLADDSSLTNRRILSPGLWLDGTDAGAGNNYTLDFIPNPREFYYFHDDFLGGGTAVEGDHIWEQINLTSNSTTGEANHPGIMLCETSATINTITRLALFTRGVISVWPLPRMDNVVWGLDVIARANQTTEHKLRFGVAKMWGQDPPTDGFYWENISAASAANWDCITRASSSEENNDSGSVLDTSWHAFGIRSDGAGNIRFYLDGTLKATNTTNLSTDNCTVSLQNKNTEGVNKQYDLDAVTFWMKLNR